MRLGWCASIYRLPSCVELQDDATLLADLVRFTLHPEGFRLPADWKRSFQLVRCADFFFGGGGGGQFHAVCGQKRCVSKQQRSTMQSEFVWFAICFAPSIARLATVLKSTLANQLCYTSLGKQAPYYLKIVVMPCCHHMVHAE